MKLAHQVSVNLYFDPSLHDTIHELLGDILIFNIVTWRIFGR